MFGLRTTLPIGSEMPGGKASSTTSSTVLNTWLALAQHLMKEIRRWEAGGWEPGLAVLGNRAGL